MVCISNANHRIKNIFELIDVFLRFLFLLGRCSASSLAFCFGFLSRRRWFRCFSMQIYLSNAAFSRCILARPKCVVIKIDLYWLFVHIQFVRTLFTVLIRYLIRCRFQRLPFLIEWYRLFIYSFQKFRKCSFQFNGFERTWFDQFWWNHYV